VKMPVSAKEALTRSRRINCGRGSEKRGILFVKFPFIFFGVRSKLNGSLGYRDTVDVIQSATFTTTTLIEPHLAMHYDDFSRVSR